MGTLSLLGPGRALKEQSARGIVNQEYLAMGLARMCEVENRLKAAGKEDPAIGLKLVGSFSEQEVADTKRKMEAAGFSAEYERIYVYSNMAVLQFSSIAQQTPGVKEILGLISDRPGMMSAGNLFLDWKNCAVEPSDEWGVGSLKVYCIPFIYTLKKTKVKGMFYVTYPQPPLQTVGGILAITCTSSKSPGVTLAVRSISGARGPALQDKN